MIIGVVGSIASGKSVLSEMLVSKGFSRLSFSDEVRIEAKARKQPIERKVLQDIGNEMRERFGNDYWARRLLEKVENGKNYVIEGIRNPGEIEALRKLNEFVLVGIDAPVERRFQWIIARGKDSDPKTIEGVKLIDARDRGQGEAKSGQQVDACFALADYYLMNEGSLEDLKGKSAKLLMLVDSIFKVRIGKYQHYKGNFYEVLGLAHHSEDLERFVVYRGLYKSHEFGPNPLWIRPLSMFFENVESNGEVVPRFKFVGEM